MTLLVQFGLDRLPDLAHVPTLLELAPPDKKDVVEFITAGTPFARGRWRLGQVCPADPGRRVAQRRSTG